MKKSIKNKMKMYQMVLDILDEHQPIWESIPNFVLTFATYSTKFETLKIQAEKQRSYVVGVTAQRDEFRSQTAKMGLRVASAVTALGEDLKDLELIALMRISESQLTRRSQTDTLILLDRIVHYAQLHADELIDYGITEQIMADFIQCRDNLAVNILAPCKAINKRRDSSAMIEDLRRELDLILSNKLDKLILVLRPISESFYGQYTDARKVFNRVTHGSTEDDQQTNPEDEGV